jgi:hypothetical protein
MSEPFLFDVFFLSHSAKDKAAVRPRVLATVRQTLVLIQPESAR